MFHKIVKILKINFNFQNFFEECHRTIVDRSRLYRSEMQKFNLINMVRVQEFIVGQAILITK